MPDIPISKFKKDAKALHKAFLAGDSDAKQRVSAIFKDVTEVTLQQVQLVIAREAGFDSWKKLLDDSDKLLHCNFCGKSQHEVRKLIAGPNVYVCDECVGLCNNIIYEESSDSRMIDISGEGGELKARDIVSALIKYEPDTPFFIRRL